MKTYHLIGDGYTRDGYIAEDPGIHPALEFRYRPMRAATRQQYLFLNEKYMAPQGVDGIGDSPAFVGMNIEIILKFCVDLTLQDCNDKPLVVIRAGKPVEQAERILARMEPNLQLTLRNILLGLTRPGIKPVDLGDGKTAIPTTTDEQELEARLLSRSRAPETPAQEEDMIQEAQAGN